MWERMWSKENILPLLVRVQTHLTYLKISMVVSQKFESQSISKPSNIILGHIPKRCSIIPQRHLLNYVPNSIIYKSQNLETTKIPLNQRRGEENVEHLHNGVLLSSKKSNGIIKFSGR